MEQCRKASVRRFRVQCENSLFCERGHITTLVAFVSAALAPVLCQFSTDLARAKTYLGPPSQGLAYSSDMHDISDKASAEARIPGSTRHSRPLNS